MPETPKTQAEFETLLDTYNVYVERTLLFLFERQTADEQTSQHTVHRNGMGFTGIDGEILSSFAKQVLNRRQQGVPPGRCLSPKQLEVCRKRDKRNVHKLGKYWRQIQEGIAAKATEVAAAATTSAPALLGMVA